LASRKSRGRRVKSAHATRLYVQSSVPGRRGPPGRRPPCKPGAFSFRRHGGFPRKRGGGRPAVVTAEYRCCLTRQILEGRLFRGVEGGRRAPTPGRSGIMRANGARLGGARLS